MKLTPQVKIEQGNALKQRLDSICLQQALKVASEEFKIEDPFNEILASTLWQIAAREIPRVYGEDGKKAIHFMEMMAYIGDDKYNFVGQIGLLNFSNTLDILSSWGLLATSRDGNSNFALTGDWKCPSGTIYFHSHTLMRTIVEENESRQESLLKDFFTQLGYLQFTRANYRSIWSIAYQYEDIFQEYFCPYVFEYSQMSEMEKQLFDNILEKYQQAPVHGKIYEEIVYIKVLLMNHMLEYGFDSIGLQGVWRKWNDNGYRTCFEDFMTSHQSLGSTGTNLFGKAFHRIAKSILAFVNNPRPRPEYEDVFLKDGFQFIKRLVQFGNGHHCNVGEFVLSYGEDLNATGLISVLLRSYFEQFSSLIDQRDFKRQGFRLVGPEKQILEMCLNLATIPTTEFSIRNTALSKLLVVTEHLYRNILLIFKQKETQTFRYWNTMTDLPQAVLSHIKCLEGLEKHSEVIQIISESQVLQMDFSDKLVLKWIGPSDVKGSQSSILEIKAILSRCEKVTLGQG